jgi:uncharacterized membrane protein
MQNRIIYLLEEIESFAKLDGPQ